MSAQGVDPRVALGSALTPGSALPVLEALDRLRPVVRVSAGASPPVALAAVRAVLPARSGSRSHHC